MQDRQPERPHTSQTRLSATRLRTDQPPFAVAVGVFRENKGRSWRRASRIAAQRYSLGKAQNALDLKFRFGTTAEMYATWAHKSGTDVLTDELSEGATLHWICPRRQ